MSRSRVFLLLFATASSAVMANATAAQEAGQQVAMLDGMTVSATRSPMKAFSYPGSVSVIDREEIDDLLPSSTSDLFEGVPGVQFSGGPRRTGETPSIRGLSGDRVLTLFEGVRQNFSSGHDGQFFVDPDLLKSAEVVRGPASALYGSGALGGVISFRMIDAADFLGEDDTSGIRLKGGFQGVNDEWTGGVTGFTRSADGRFDGVANFTYRTSDDIELGDGTSLSSDDEIMTGIAKGSFKVSDALTLSLLGQTFNNDALEPNNGQDVLATDLVEKDISSSLIRAGALFNPESDLINGEVILFKNDSEVEEAETDSSRVVSRKVETLGIVLDNRSTFMFDSGSMLTLTYGGEYYKDEQTGTDNMTTDGTRGGVPDADAKTVGLFAQAEFSVMSPIGELIVIPAIRYDSFKNDSVDGMLETDDSATSPKIGVTWHPTSWLMAFGNWAEAFRAPNYNEIFADDIHFTIPLGPGLEAPNSFIPNTDLMPEDSETWEVGGGVDFDEIFSRGDRFTAKASYYESDVENLIDLDVDFALSPSCFSPMIPGPCTSGTSRYANVANAEITGFELEAAYDNERIYLNASYSSVDGRDKADDSYVGTLTPNRVFLSGGIKLPEIDSRLGGRVEIAGRHDKVDDEADERPGYEVLDLYFVWQPSRGALKGLRLDLGVDNVTDATYERVFAGVREPGRNFKAAASWTETF